MAANAKRQTAIRPIYVTRDDHKRLSLLVGSCAAATPGATLLRDELDRAIVVGEGDLPQRFVQVGSLVLYEDQDSGKTRSIQLVMPDAADIDENRVSILTPVGAALLGLREGQSFDWAAADGRRRRLRIVKVEAAREPI